TGFLRRREDLELAAHLLGHCLRDAGVATRPRLGDTSQRDRHGQEPPYRERPTHRGAHHGEPEAGDRFVGNTRETPRSLIHHSSSVVVWVVASAGEACRDRGGVGLQSPTPSAPPRRSRTVKDVGTLLRSPSWGSFLLQRRREGRPYGVKTSKR